MNPEKSALILGILFLLAVVLVAVNAADTNQTAFSDCTSDCKVPSDYSGVAPQGSFTDASGSTYKCSSCTIISSGGTILQVDGTNVEVKSSGTVIIRVNGAAVSGSDVKYDQNGFTVAGKGTLNGVQVSDISNTKVASDGTIEGSASSQGGEVAGLKYESNAKFKYDPKTKTTTIERGKVEIVSAEAGSKLTMMNEANLKAKDISISCYPQKSCTISFDEKGNPYIPAGQAANVNGHIIDGQGKDVYPCSGTIPCPTDKNYVQSGWKAKDGTDAIKIKGNVDVSVFGGKAHLKNQEGVFYIRHEGCGEGMCGTEIKFVAADKNDNLELLDADGNPITIDFKSNGDIVAANSCTSPPAGRAFGWITGAAAFSCIPTIIVSAPGDTKTWRDDVTKKGFFYTTNDHITIGENAIGMYTIYDSDGKIIAYTPDTSSSDLMLDGKKIATINRETKKVTFEPDADRITKTDTTPQEVKLMQDNAATTKPGETKPIPNLPNCKDDWGCIDADCIYRGNRRLCTGCQKQPDASSYADCI